MKVRGANSCISWFPHLWKLYDEDLVSFAVSSISKNQISVLPFCGGFTENLGVSVTTLQAEGVQPPLRKNILISPKFLEVLRWNSQSTRYI